MSEIIETYSAKHVAMTLGIALSTVRKHCSMLESHGYTMSRNEEDFRIFYEHDIAVLRRLGEESKKGRKLDDIAMELAERQQEKNNIKGNPPTPSDASLIRTLIEKIDILTKMFEASEASREEERRMTQMLLRKLEAKDQEVIEMREEVAAAVEKEEKKSFFKRFFR